MTEDGQKLVFQVLNMLIKSCNYSSKRYSSESDIGENVEVGEFDIITFAENSAAAV